MAAPHEQLIRSGNRLIDNPSPLDDRTTRSITWTALKAKLKITEAEYKIIRANIKQVLNTNTKVLETDRERIIPEIQALLPTGANETPTVAQALIIQYLRNCNKRARRAGHNNLQSASFVQHVPLILPSPPPSVIINRHIRASSSSSQSRISESPWLVWCPFSHPNSRTITETFNLAVDATGQHYRRDYPMYKEENVSMLRRRLGKHYADFEHETPVLHQGVVTMEHLKHVFGREVLLAKWKWLVDQTSEDPQPRRGKQDPQKTKMNEAFHRLDIPCVFFLHWTVDPGPPIALIYGTIMAQAALRSCMFRCFPLQSELMQDVQKFGDIRVLDEIAASSPPQFAYRPITCFGIDSDSHVLSGGCPLREIPKIVMKRSNSCGAEHVKIRGPDRTGCSEDSTRAFRWCAQEFVPSLQNFGEFRVFITTKSSYSSLRGRVGEIVCTSITEWQDGALEQFEARSVNASDWARADFDSLNSKRLEEFALYIFNELRGRPDWREYYESLEIGVRLDIGVSEDHRFFVNEITRFYCADYFSLKILAYPHQKICLAFATSINEYFSGGSTWSI